MSYFHCHEWYWGLYRVRDSVNVKRDICPILIYYTMLAEYVNESKLMLYGKIPCTKLCRTR